MAWKFRITSNRNYSHYSDDYKGNRGLFGAILGSDNSMINQLGSALGIGNMQELINSLIAHFTRNELTGAENEQNAFNAQQAELADQRQFDYTMRNYREAPSAQVEGYQAAGLNPALMYGSGASFNSGQGTAASGSAGGSGDIIAGLMNLIRMPLELKQLEAGVEKTRADAELARQKKKTEEQETKIRSINAEYTESLNGQTLENMKADYNNKVADTDYKVANKDYVNSQKEAQDTINKYLDERQREEINQIKGNIDKMSAEEKKIKAEKVYQDWYNNFVKSNDFLPSSNDALMLATYIASLLGIGKGDVENVVHDLLTKGNMPRVSKEDKPNKAWFNELDSHDIKIQNGGSR